MLMDKVDTCMLIDIGLGFYAVHHIHGQGHGLGSFVFKFWLMFLYVYIS